MEHFLEARARPFYTVFVRALFLACVLLLAWTSYSALSSGRSVGESAVSILLPTALVLGTGGQVLGDRHPRLRWALLIGSGILSLIALFVFRSRLLTK
jgi:hypothetical protein